MFDPKARRRSRPNTAGIQTGTQTGTQKSSPAKMALMPNTPAPQDKIRERAYELYESRGCEPGQDEQDWLRAERELLTV